MKTQALSLFLVSCTAFAALAGCGDDSAYASTAASSGSGTGTGGAGTGGSGSGGGTGGGGNLGDPITAPDEQWTWVPFPDALCANGSPTGLAVNLTTKSKKLLIYMQGGGACWDDLTCHTLMTAVNLDGYNETNFQSDLGTLNGVTFFSRTDAENPFRDYSYFVVPYCTGDVHAGDNIAQYAGGQIMHVGRKNVEAFLRRIVPTIAGADYVVVSGSSAGGFGSGMNWKRTQDAFGATRVDLFDDSGPPLPAPYLKDSLQQAWRTAWNLNPGLPPDCTECATRLDALLSYYASIYPDHRGTLLSYLQDGVIAQYFQISGADVEAGLNAIAQDTFTPSSTFKYFYIPGSSHTVFGNPKGITQNGVRVIDFITQMVTEDPSWASVHP